tara:strand:+ start:66 stop:1013 length:948 start_codon:yes stop_codon:yes gene_type:complete
MKIYKQLTYEERYTLMSLKKAKFSNKKIAIFLNRAVSTIGRELKRNKGKRYYSAKQAHSFYISRRQIPKVNSKLTEQIKSIIDYKLAQKKWSPEQISNHLKEINLSVSHELIYQYVHKNKLSGGILYKSLRRTGKKYRKRNINKIRIKNRVSITERPGIVSKKQRFGDWEGDTIIGKGHKSSVLTLVERKSKFLLIRKLANHSSEELNNAILKSFKKAKGLFKTLTVDNGLEFAGHEKITNNLDGDVYFANPYSPWERGLNENTNGLIRQFFPKGTDFNNILEDEVLHVQHLINSRPRKTLGYKTPYEVLASGIN